MDDFIQIRSTRFPVLPGEDEELVNDGTWGKALAEYLRERLRERGYDSPFACCEDWGWWVDLRGDGFRAGVCVYCRPGQEPPVDFACTGGTTKRRPWSWRRLRFLDLGAWNDRLREDLLDIFEKDADVQIVGRDTGYPF